MKKRPSQLVVTWLLSYLLILCLPIFTSIFITESYSHKMSEQTYEMNQFVSNAMADNITDVLVGIRRFYADVIFHKNLETVLTISAEEPRYSTNAEDFLSWFRDTSLNNPSYETAYIYLPSTDTVISVNGVYRGQFYFDTFFDDTALSYEEWQQSHFPESGSYCITEAVKNASHNPSNEMVSYNMLMPQHLQQIYGNISLSVIVKKSDFFKLMSNSKWFSDCDIYIFDNSGLLFQSNASARLNPASIDELMATNHKNDIVQIDNIEHDSINMTLVTIINKNLMFNELSQLRIMTIIVIVFCILLGSIAAKYFVKRNYKPIKEILEICGFGDSKDDEYSNIKYSLEKAFLENNNLQRITEKYKTSLRSIELGKLLSGRPADLQEYDIHLYDGSLMVFAFDTEEFRNFLPSENLSEEQRIIEVRFIITNIFEEIFNTSESTGYVVDIGGSLLCVVSHILKENDFFQKNIRYGLNAIHQYFNLRLTVAASDLHYSREQLRVAYDEAMYALEYRQIKNYDKSLWFSDIEKGTIEGYHFSSERENKLINLIKMGEHNDTKNYINELFDEIKADETLSLENAKILMVDISATLLKIPDFLTLGEAESSKTAESLLTCSTLEEMREHLLNIVNDYFTLKRAHDQKVDFETIRIYIERNYSDPNLNINSIGNHFNIYPAYLSKLFKKYCNVAMPDYINILRIRRSKEMLENTELTISDIASRVGYGHIRTFNRVFKKYEGVTPSSFRSGLN